jgi:hypothetical protein
MDPERTLAACRDGAAWTASGFAETLSFDFEMAGRSRVDLSDPPLHSRRTGELRAGKKTSDISGDDVANTTCERSAHTAPVG